MVVFSSGKYMDRMHASHRMGMENQTFMKVAAICTWLGDFITAWMVTDMMLQVNTYIIFPLTNTEYAIHCWVVYFTKSDRIRHSDSRGTDGQIAAGKLHLLEISIRNCSPLGCTKSHNWFQLH